MTSQVDQYAAFSFQHRRDKSTADDVPSKLQTTSLTIAYQVQDKLVTRLLNLIGGHKIGYKIGCTSEGAQQLLNTDSPVYGQMFSAWTYTSPAALPADEFQMIVIEPEFAFTLNATIPLDTYDATTIRPFVANVMPSIEEVHHRLGGWGRYQSDYLTE